MFSSFAHRLRSWWDEATDDILGGDLPDDAQGAEYFRNHPHRRALGSPSARRAGSVPARPAHCLTPLRTGPPLERSGHTV